VFFKSFLVAEEKALAIKRKIAMSIARDDMGNIRELHTAAGLPHNFRDASGGTDRTQVYVNSFANQLIHVCVTAGCYFRQMAEEANANYPRKSEFVLPSSFVRGRRNDRGRNRDWLRIHTAVE
jgi:hypothetical protein